MEIRFVINADHPSLPGHFPGRPIVPGVLLLDAVAGALAADLGLRCTQLKYAKFMSPLLPGEVCRVILTPADGQLLRFDCVVGERPVASGVFVCRPAEPA